ncbi:9587_t:CDS:2 [Funneliformis mosseae]|uniref:9587_t:CDS:1 n=1 Tax=Funneliformis mosseae TaxID=27381 RepID=A0A9N8YPR7_FUNMO|nr:9587_t:CDS:2 [Funneliformis mosseae]
MNQVKYKDSLSGLKSLQEEQTAILEGSFIYSTSSSLENVTVKE